MNDSYGTVVEAGTVRFERLLPGPIERVWAYLTDGERRGRWLASGPMELRVGGRVELRFRHADLSSRHAPAPERFKQYEQGQSLYGRITRCDPPRLLAYTWGDEPADSEVSFELTPRGENVLLVLTHRRLERSEMTDTAAGWHTHLDILADDLNGRERPPFWPAWMQLEKDYKQRLAAG